MPVGLIFFENPNRAYIKIGKSPDRITAAGIGTLLDDVFSELERDTGFRDKLVQDLYNAGLTTVERQFINTMMSASGAFSPRLTTLGKLFLEFISNPAI